MLEQRIALLEGSEAARCTASGMAAMTAALLCQLQAGDHLVGAKAAFGSCRWLTDNLLPKFGIATTVVETTDTEAWEKAIRPETKVFFFETPTNPTLAIADLEAICRIAKAHGIVTVVDNAFATPLIQRPMDYGADIVAYSATKMMDGQGRVLAGAICGTEDFILNTLLPFTRNTGPTLSAFNAWVVLKGLETMDLRLQRQSQNALKVAAFLEKRVPGLLYPALPSHPQHDLAMRQMKAGGTVLAMTLDGGRAQAHALLDALELVDISNNLGDSRSMMTHPASTTHSGLTAEVREDMGIEEGMLRLSVGLEDPDDVIDDFDQALKKVGL
jgi:cystathionine beta-lyase/cystathionine gamma-synthase